MGDKRQQWIPIPVDIGDQDRLAMAAELSPGQLLDQFFERADPAGQGDKGIGAIKHCAFTLMHIAGDDQLLAEPAWPLASGEKFGDNSGGLAAMRQHGVGEYAHQADRTAAID